MTPPLTTVPLWLDDDGACPVPGAGATGRGGARADGSRPARPVEVEIVGAGVTGLSCALTLARAGVAVRVHDARPVGGGASGRNAGFALRGAALAYDEARARLGGAAAQGIWALSESALARLVALAGDAFRAEGSLRLAVDAAELERLRAEHDALREDGFAADWCDPPVGGCDGRFLGAVFHPGDGALQPLRWIRRLAAAAQEAGAEVRERSPVVSLSALEAAHVVVATDGYGQGLLPALDAAILPARGQVLATAPAANRVVACPHYARDGYDYWQQLPDGRLVVGGFRDTAREAEATREEAVTAAVQVRLELLAAAILGERPQVTHRWAGVWGETADRLPLAGPVAPGLAGRRGVWVAAGYSGHGNVLGLACGDLVARGLQGEAVPELQPFAPERLLGAPAGG